MPPVASPPAVDSIDVPTHIKTRKQFSEWFQDLLNQKQPCEEMACGEEKKWKLISNEDPAKLKGKSSRLTPLEREHLERYELAEELMYGLHRLGLDALDKGDDQGPYTSWRLVSTVADDRRQIQDAYCSAVEASGARPDVWKQTHNALQRWCRWEIGGRARLGEGSKADARRSLCYLMWSRPDLIRSRFLHHIIALHFFPTAKTHAMEKARRDWDLIRAGIDLLELVGDAERTKAGAGNAHWMELLDTNGRGLRRAVTRYRERLRAGPVSFCDPGECDLILDRWVEQSEDAAREEKHLPSPDHMWQDALLEKKEEEEVMDDKDKDDPLKVAEAFTNAVIPEMTPHEEERLLKILRSAQSHPPSDPPRFVELMNKVLVAHDRRLRIDGEDEEFRLRTTPARGNGRPLIQLMGKKGSRGFVNVEIGLVR